MSPSTWAIAAIADNRMVTHCESVDHSESSQWISASRKNPQFTGRISARQFWKLLSRILTRSIYVELYRCELGGAIGSMANSAGAKEHVQTSTNPETYK
jgi:hypothetical protein